MGLEILDVQPYDTDAREYTVVWFVCYLWLICNQGLAIPSKSDHQKIGQLGTEFQAFAFEQTEPT